MDLRAYYQTIRRIEGEIREESVVIVSAATPDGGRAGVLTEVPRAVAARLVVEQKAELASEEAAAKFRSGTESKWRSANGAAGAPKRT